LSISQHLGENILKYEAVIFDLFGTLIDKVSLRQHTNVLRQMAYVLSAPPDDFVRLWFDTFDERGLGIFQSLVANIEYICQKLELHPERNRVMLAAQINLQYTTRAMKPRPYATDLLSSLKSEGYKTGLVTNCSAEVPAIWEDTPFAPLIDVTVFSCKVGVQKPAPLIYQLTAEQLAVKPEACLYIGDGDSHELTGAAQVGMHPVLIRDPDEDRTDVHRVDWEAEDWHGPVITSLKDVLNLVR